MSTDREVLLDVYDRLLDDPGVIAEVVELIRRHVHATPPPPEPVAPINADPQYRAGWDAGVEYGTHLAQIAARARERAAYAAGRAREAGAHP